MFLMYDLADECAVGEYWNADNEQCEDCAIGTYKAVTGQDPCTPCESGKTTLAVKSDNVASCIGKLYAKNVLNLLIFTLV